MCCITIFARLCLTLLSISCAFSAKTKHVGNCGAVVGPHEMFMEENQVSQRTSRESKQCNEVATRASERLTAQARRAQESSEQRAQRLKGNRQQEREDEGRDL